MPPDNDDDTGMVWIRSDVLPDGSYTAAVHFDPDTSVALTPATASSYALAVLDAVQSAEYDAAVLAQLHGKRGLDEKLAAEFVTRDLRPQRRPPRTTGTPLTLTPGVSHRDRRGFLTVTINGATAGQWELAAAREHALTILEAVAAAEHDTAYHRVLVQTLDLDDDRARAIVEDIANYRNTEPRYPDHGA